MNFFRSACLLLFLTGCVGNTKPLVHRLAAAAMRHADSRTEAADELWGMAHVTYQYVPPASGSDKAALGLAVEAKLPMNVSADSRAVFLEDAAIWTSCPGSPRR